ncbi:MAG TPA: hypothetical protein VJT50_13980 [Pyrinomonadaceae bacterium]|nr:hypothetical protein [Pyrinomonadaceae bacterium]
MKRCPSCNRTYTDASLNFCLEDGTPLINEAAAGGDPNATVQYGTRDTNPPATQIYPLPSLSPPPPPVLNPPSPPVSTPPAGPVSRPPSAGRSPQWTPPPSLPGSVPRKKSGAIWWIIGGVVAVGVIAVGLIVMLIVLASINSNTNNANNRNSNGRVANRNANLNANSTPVNTSNVNSSASLPALVTDDFSEEKWGVGNFSYGDIWYDNDEYHMRAKDKSYLVMYAPTNDYSTGDAQVKVTVHSVDGTPSPTGYGLIVHGEKSKAGELEDYALLIYTGDDPQYEIIKHKAGQQTTVVPWAKSSVIRSGTSTNQLEVRARGTELTFYINGQYVDEITDNENFKRGLAGFYTSGVTEVAFDDLEIKR